MSALYSDATSGINVEYYTPAPEAEEFFVEKGKNIKIFAPDELGYENVRAFTYLDNVREESILLRHVESGEKINFVSYDLDRDGFVDYIEWKVPHLSEQNYELRIEVLNPLEYLKDGDTWKVYFNTTGIGNLTISSTNANFEEVSVDDLNTNDELEFLDLKCGDKSLVKDLYIISSGEYYKYSDAEGSLRVDGFFIENYSCFETGELSAFMNIGGYAILNFSFRDESRTVSDLAVDPSWLTGYDYRKEINITAGTNAGNDYPVKFSFIAVDKVSLSFVLAPRVEND